MALALLAMKPDVRALLSGTLMKSVRAVQAFALPESDQAEIMLKERKIYALQLGAYDDGERAKREQNRLFEAGLPTIIWQKEQMRLICSAALLRSGVDVRAAKGQEAWVIEQNLGEVQLRIQCGAAQLDEVRTLLLTPDALLNAVCAGDALDGLLERTRMAAQNAMGMYPDVPIYDQLAQSLANWCDLMERVRDTAGEETARHYASATLAILCDELRQALTAAGNQSEASTASAQRTPSTAADVMPPA